MRDGPASTSGNPDANDQAGRGLASVRHWFRGKGKVVAGAVLTVALVSAGGSVALAANGSDDGRYRLVTAAMGSVEQNVTLSGTVSSVSKAVAAFSVAGTVATVPATVGAKVKAGDVLATLDVTSLQRALDYATDSYNTAQDTLNTDLESQTTGTGATQLKSSGGAGAMGVVMIVPAALSAAVQAALDAVTSAQSALMTQYSTAAAAVDAANSAAAAAKTACANITLPGDIEVSDDADTTKANVDAANGAIATAKDQVAACQASVQQADTAAAAAKKAQNSVSAAAKALDTAVANLKQAVKADAASSGSGSGASTPTPKPTTPATKPEAKPTAPATKPDTKPTTQATKPETKPTTQATKPETKPTTPVTKPETKPTTQAGTANGAGAQGAGGKSAGGQGACNCKSSGGQSLSAQQGSAGSLPSGSSLATGGASASEMGQTGGASASSGTASAEQILADRANVELAKSKVAQAKAALAQAKLRTPIDGTVAAVALAVDDDVPAASTTQTVTVIGDDGYLVTASAPLAKIDAVKEGQDVAVTLPGVVEPLAGTVSRIGPLNTAGDGATTPTYSVTVALAGQPDVLNGATVQLDVVTEASEESVIVPTSALHRSRGSYTVYLLDDGTRRAQSVQVGTIGSEMSQITKGVEAGEQVILADLTQAMDSGTSSNSSTSLTGLSGSGQGNFSQFGPAANFGGQGGMQPPSIQRNGR